MIKKKFLKICICLLSVVLAGGIYASASGEAQSTESFAESNAPALDPPYEMTERYRSGGFYKNLTKLSLSGDGKRDVMAVALSQVGYHEGDSISDLDGNSTSGTKDFVEYSELPGDWGDVQGEYWCAAFVNWCLRMAGVDESLSGSEVSCMRWYEDCMRLGIFKSKSGYLPNAGDIIFFNDSVPSRLSTHVGLVRYSDGTYVYTVEGNTSNGSGYSSDGEYVALKKHELSSQYIVGYAVPNYEDAGSDRTVDHSGRFLSRGEYIIQSGCDIYSDPELKALSGKKLSPFTAFSVTEIHGSVLKISTDFGEGYISKTSDIVQLTATERIYVINYVNEDGYPIYLPQYRRADEQKYAYSNSPSRKDSVFVGWRMEESPKSIFDPGDKLPCFAGDMTFIAVFDSNTYKVVYKSSDGTLLGEFSGQYGTKYEIPTPPAAPEGYVFYGWGSESDGIIRGDAVYTAVYISEDELNAADADAEQNGETAAGCSSSISGAGAVVACVLPCLVLFRRKRERK